MYMTTYKSEMFQQLQSFDVPFVYVASYERTNVVFVMQSKPLLCLESQSQGLHHSSVDYVTTSF